MRHPELRGERIVLHLEDDETQILTTAYESSTDAVWDWGIRRWLLRGFGSWSHPRLALGLASLVDGVTAVSPSLKEIIPPSVPFQTLRPPISEFETSVAKVETERGLIAYAGAIHPAVERDFAELGIAVGMLNRPGRVVRLIRCGPPIQGDIRGRLAKRGCEFEDLGLLPLSEVREWLMRSEILVQPGIPNDFNRRRLPSKLLDYFATGRPVVMPGCYGWLGFEDGKDAVVCNSGTAVEIAGKCASLFDDRERADSIGCAGKAKATEVFDPKQCSAQLDAFLRHICSSEPKLSRDWVSAANPAVEIPNLLAQQKSAPDSANWNQLAREVAATGFPRVAEENLDVEIFWAANDHFSQSNSCARQVTADRWIRLKLGPLPCEVGDSIRLDPCSMPAEIELTRVAYYSTDGRQTASWRSSELKHLVTLGGTATINDKRRGFVVDSSGNDPQLILPPAPEPDIVAEVWMKVLPRKSAFLPTVSLIIACHNRLELTRALVGSLKGTISDNSIEVVFVDNGGTDGTAAWLESNLPADWKIQKNKSNLGFAAANNQAAKSAKGSVLVFLNNDLVMRPGWLEPMIAALEENTAVFAVGNVQHAVSDGRLDHAGMLFDLNGHPVHYRPSEDMLRNTDVREFPAVTFACCAVRKDRFLELGGFDEAYRNGFEDVDLCLRARAKGWKCYVANQSAVDHHVSASPGRKDHEDANMRLFFDRWQPIAVELGNEWRERLTLEERSMSSFPVIDENAGYSAVPGMRHFVDEPENWEQPTPMNVVRGWCFNLGATPVHSVRARSKEGIWTGVQGMERPDVAAAHKQMAGALRSGFAVRFPRPRQVPCEVALEAILDDGSIVLLRKVVVR